MIPIGIYEQQGIVSNGIEATQSGKEFIRLDFEINGEPICAKIWLTDKAMGMARQQLRLLGLDPDTIDLNDLIDKPNMLTGVKADVMVEHDEQYGVQASLVMNRVDKTRAKSLTQRLRAAKSKKDDTPPKIPATAAAGGDSGPITESDLPF
jgi:hypothetical protein